MMQFGWWLIGLTKSAYFILVKMTMSIDKLILLYMDNILNILTLVHLYQIFSDRDERFTAKVSKKFPEAMGTELKFSTTLYPLTGGQSKRMIQILENVFSPCVLDWQGSREDHLPLVEFPYNNSFQSII